MFVHHPSNFAHVAVPRCGGGSLRAALGDALGVERGFALPAPQLDHLSAADARRLLGRRRWPQLFSVAVVRNPYDRAVSLFHDARAAGRVQAGGFDAFVRGPLEELARSHVRFLPQRRFLCEPGADAPPLVKRVYAFEDGVQPILDDICARLERERIAAPHLGRATRRRWEEYYDRRDTLDRVTRFYEEDFELFGYAPLREPPLRLVAVG